MQNRPAPRLAFPARISIRPLQGHPGTVRRTPPDILPTPHPPNLRRPCILPSQSPPTAPDILPTPNPPTLRRPCIAQAQSCLSSAQGLLKTQYLPPLFSTPPATPESKTH